MLLHGYASISAHQFSAHSLCHDGIPKSKESGEQISLRARPRQMEEHLVEKAWMYWKSDWSGHL